MTATHVWLSGRDSETPRGESRDFNWLKSQGLAANPPTRKTVCRGVSYCRANIELILTDTVFEAIRLCSLMASTIAMMDGSNISATSNLEKLVH